MTPLRPTLLRLATLPGFWLGRAAVADSPRRAGEYLAIAQELEQTKTLPPSALKHLYVTERTQK